MLLPEASVAPLFKEFQIHRQTKKERKKKITFLGNVLFRHSEGMYTRHMSLRIVNSWEEKKEKKNEHYQQRKSSQLKEDLAQNIFPEPKKKRKKKKIKFGKQLSPVTPVQHSPGK